MYMYHNGSLLFPVGSKAPKNDAAETEREPFWYMNVMRAMPIVGAVEGFDSRMEVLLAHPGLSFEGLEFRRVVCVWRGHLYVVLVSVATVGNNQFAR